MRQEMKTFSFKMALATIAALLLFLMLNVTTVFANPVSDAKNGVLQIQVVATDGSGNVLIKKTGSGFLIGASNGAKTVITNSHVVILTEEDKDDMTERYGADYHSASVLNNVNLTINVVVQRDLVVSAKYINGSESDDFAILELTQPIYDRTALKIADSDNVHEPEDVYALGFPIVNTVSNDTPLYTSDNVTVSSGKINKIQSVENTKYIIHSAMLGHGNSGGPLLNSDGDVIGVNTMSVGEEGGATYYYSLAINQVTSALKSLGIVYESSDGTSASEIDSTNDPADEESVADDPIADDPADSESATEQGDTVAVPPTNKDDDKPVVNDEPEEIIDETKDGMNMTIIIVAVVAVVVVIIIVIIIVAVSGSKKKKNRMTPLTSGQMPPYGAPHPAPQQPYGQPPVPPAFNGAVPPAGAGETSVLGGGAGETSVLGGGAGETSVLGGSPTATLIRKKNNESARIAKANFAIGKERSKVDFCIPDNTSISRTHARIVCRGGAYYIVDNNSTNFTFVNGNKINPGQEVKINSGDIIKLSDEEFEFRM